MPFLPSARSCLPGDRGVARRAFSLPELLVSIGVVAILLSLALPALGSVRRTAQRLGCQSNIRQMVTLVAAYTDSSRGAFPAMVSDGLETRDDRSRWVSYSLQPHYVFARQPWADFAGIDMILGEILYCPANQAYPEFYTELGVGDPDYNLSGSVYVSPSYLDPSLPEPVWSSMLGARVQRLDSLAFPSQKAVLFESMVWHDWPGGWCVGCSVNGLGHSDGKQAVGSVAFGDGHVVGMPAADAEPPVRRYPVWGQGEFGTTAWGVLGIDQK